MARSADAKKGDVMVLVGTRKGAFVLTGDHQRKRWSVSKLSSQGGGSASISASTSGVAGDVFHMAYDARDVGTLFAGVNNNIFGPQIFRSSDQPEGS